MTSVVIIITISVIIGCIFLLCTAKRIMSRLFALFFLLISLYIIWYLLSGFLFLYNWEPDTYTQVLGDKLESTDNYGDKGDIWVLEGKK